jgi:hypothetical protein
VKSRFGPLLALVKGLQPKVKLALAGVTILFVALVFATCSACRRTSASSGAKSPAASATPAVDLSSKKDVNQAAAGAGADEPLLWQHARLGDAENLSNLAGYEGPVGLQEVADRDPGLRPIAIKAMAYVHGFAQLPYLAKAAAGSNDEEATLALDSILEIATRPRTSADPEDAEELAEGCSTLLAIAKDTGKSKPRRVNSVRALRMLPCPSAEGSGELRSSDVPSDVDAK